MKILRWLFNQELINLPKNKKLRRKTKAGAPLPPERKRSRVLQEKKQPSPYRTEAPEITTKPSKVFDKHEKVNDLSFSWLYPRLRDFPERYTPHYTPQKTSQDFLPYVHKLKAGEQNKLKIFSGMAPRFQTEHLQIKVYKEEGKDKSYVFIKNIIVNNSMQTLESYGDFFSSEFYENKQDAAFHVFDNFQNLTLEAKNPHDFDVEVHVGLWGQSKEY